MHDSPPLAARSWTSSRDHGNSVSGAASPQITASTLLAELGRDDETTWLFRCMDRHASWRPCDSVVMKDWTTFHTQGMVKIGDDFIVSAVEITQQPQRSGTQTDALTDFSIDRTPGRGRAWLFKFSARGRLLQRLELTDGTLYHPGGIDYDGRHVWVPVSEYRPNSRSHVFRVEPDSFNAELVLCADDHIGAIVHNIHRGTLHGVSWGSRRLHTWHKSLHDGTWRGTWVGNSDFFVDYQDCHYVGLEYMLCGGVARYDTPRGPIAFGGMVLVDLRSMRSEHALPVNHFIDEGGGPDPGLALCHNAYWFEPNGDGSARAYFMAETNNHAKLLSFDVTPFSQRQLCFLLSPR